MVFFDQYRTELQQSFRMNMEVELLRTLTLSISWKPVRVTNARGHYWKNMSPRSFAWRMFRKPMTSPVDVLLG